MAEISHELFTHFTQFFFHLLIRVSEVIFLILTSANCYPPFFGSDSSICKTANAQSTHENPVDFDYSSFAAKNRDSTVLDWTSPDSAKNRNLSSSAYLKGSSRRCWWFCTFPSAPDWYLDDIVWWVWWRPELLGNTRLISLSVAVELMPRIE